MKKTNIKKKLLSIALSLCMLLPVIMAIGSVYLEKNKASAVAGWVQSGNDWYYYENNVTVKNDWRHIYNNAGTRYAWYHFDSNGRMKTDWQVVDGKQYYFKLKAYSDDNQGGYMLTDWQYIGVRWYYFKLGVWDPDPVKRGGYMLTDWQYIGVNWYYLEESGTRPDTSPYKGRWVNDVIPPNRYYSEYNCCCHVSNKII